MLTLSYFDKIKIILFFQRIRSIRISNPYVPLEWWWRMNLVSAIRHQLRKASGGVVWDVVDWISALASIGAKVPKIASHWPSEPDCWTMDIWNEAVKPFKFTVSKTPRSGCILKEFIKPFLLLFFILLLSNSHLSQSVRNRKSLSIELSWLLRILILNWRVLANYCIYVALWMCI